MEHFARRRKGDTGPLASRGLRLGAHRRACVQSSAPSVVDQKGKRVAAGGRLEKRDVVGDVQCVASGGSLKDIADRLCSTVWIGQRCAPSYQTAIPWYGVAAAIRCPLAKTSKPSSRATAMRVIPASSAVRTASAVGADIETRTDAPIVAAFCTISTETRLVRRTKPACVERFACAKAPLSLSIAFWRPTSSRTNSNPFRGDQKAAAWTARV